MIYTRLLLNIYVTLSYYTDSILCIIYRLILVIQSQHNVELYPWQLISATKYYNYKHTCKHVSAS